jgi:hypothetical protein
LAVTKQSQGLECEPDKTQFCEVGIASYFKMCSFLVIFQALKASNRGARNILIPINKLYFIFCAPHAVKPVFDIRHAFKIFLNINRYNFQEAFNLSK